MKRYLVFTYQSYYPSGGFKDFDSAYDTLEAAQRAEAFLRALNLWKD